MSFSVLSTGIVPNVGSISGYGHVNVAVNCASLAVSSGDIVIVDNNGVVVVGKEHWEQILNDTRRILQAEHVLQQKIQVGATIGELIDIDEVFESPFDYQERAPEDKR